MSPAFFMSRIHRGQQGTGDDRATPDPSDPTEEK